MASWGWRSLNNLWIVNWYASGYSQVHLAIFNHQIVIVCSLACLHCQVHVIQVLEYKQSQTINVLYRLYVISFTPVTHCISHEQSFCCCLILPVVYFYHCRGGNLELVIYLIENYKLNIQATGFNNWTPLHYACW